MAVPASPTTNTSPGAIRANAIIDIWRGVNISNPVPTGDPDVRDVPAVLYPAMEQGRGHYSGFLRYTHLLLTPKDIDVRDAYNSNQNTATVANADTVVVYDSEDKTKKTPFMVVFVELVNRGSVNAYLRVYLDRFQPSSWPTDGL
jgi:hypothetical protein